MPRSISISTTELADRLCVRSNETKYEDFIGPNILTNQYIKYNFSISYIFPRTPLVSLSPNVALFNPATLVIAQGCQNNVVKIRDVKIWFPIGLD